MISTHVDNAQDMMRQVCDLQAEDTRKPCNDQAHDAAMTVAAGEPERKGLRQDQLSGRLSSGRLV
jgi:hypothetical protein